MSCDCTDRQEVIDLQVRYATCLDQRDWQSLTTVLAADVVGDYGGQLVEGRDQLVRYIRARLDDCGPSQHLLGNHRVQVDGDAASAVCSARVIHLGRGSRASLDPYESIGDYHDSLRRTGNGWRIVHRRFDVRIQSGDLGVLGPEQSTLDSRRA